MTLQQFIGTDIESIAFNELIAIGLVEGIDFTFQTSLRGGRVEKGGLVIDFLFTNPPFLAINVNGIYFHYSNQFVQEASARDIIAREVLASEGIKLIFIDGDNLKDNPRFYVEQALQGIDHSRLAG